MSDSSKLVDIRSEGTLEKDLTVATLLHEARVGLEARGFDDARVNAELMLAHVLGIRRNTLMTISGRILPGDAHGHFLRLYRRRLHHEPLQYILGKTEFMGIPLFVNGSVLIPRPETEILVEKALSIMSSMHKGQITVLDIGTGSGNIPIAIASFMPSASVESIEISAEALETAWRNVHRHGITTVALTRGDVFSEFLPGRRFDILVSNPPYISRDEFFTLEPEVREFEPRIATTDDGDGLRFVRRITEVALDKLHDGGWLLMELAYNQSAEAEDILRRAGFLGIEVFNDYGGIPRIIRGRRPGVSIDAS